GRCEAVRLAAFGLVVSGGGLLSSGCGDDPEKPKMGKVTGTVMYNGKPVTDGSGPFTPDSAQGGATGQNAIRPIESDGTYTLTTFNTGDGAILGQHVVTVQAYNDPNAFKPKADGTYTYRLPKPAVPVKYTTVEKTPLRCTVVEGKNTFDIEMKD